MRLNSAKELDLYKEGVEEIVNLQPLKDGKEKAYQVKQVRVVIFKYQLHRGV